MDQSWSVPKAVEPIMPIMIIPILSSFVVGAVMLKVIGALAIAGIMDGLSNWLESIGDANAIVLEFNSRLYDCNRYGWI